MHVVHGTWIPDETSEFVQRGGLYIWVETDAPATARRGTADHPRHLTRDELSTFLIERLGLKGDRSGADVGAPLTKHLLLPTASGQPLPSFEMAPYIEEEVPNEFELTPWTIWCCRLADVIRTLNNIHFVATHGDYMEIDTEEDYALANRDWK